MSSTLGRPTDFKPEFVEQARKLCLLLGATDAQLAEFFEVTETTINNWKVAHPVFFESIKAGKEIADMEIADGLHTRAKGGYVFEQQAVKVKAGQYIEDVKVVEVKKFIPADTAAGIFWLKNRKSEKWRDKHDHALQNPDGTAIMFSTLYEQPKGN
jgi:hypothetical protein